MERKREERWRIDKIDVHREEKSQSRGYVPEMELFLITVVTQG